MYKSLLLYKEINSNIDCVDIFVIYDIYIVLWDKWYRIDFIYFIY